MKKFVFLVTIASTLSISTLWAQEAERSGYNSNSVRPIHDDDIMYKKRVWRRMDLGEKQNKPFFAMGNEISKIIVDAAKAGILPIYKNDSCTSRYTKEEFLENLENPQMQGYNDVGADDGWGGDSGGGDDWGDSGGGDDWGSDDSWGDSGSDDGDDEGGSSTMVIDTKFAARDISVLEVVEDMIFDKKRSVLVWDIQAIKLIIPAENFTAGIFREVGVFKYKDLVKLWESMPEQAIWFNPQNSAEHKNLADAFALRLFNARITKVANPDDNAIIDIYDETPRQGVIASKWAEYKLMEKEHELWSY